MPTLGAQLVGSWWLRTREDRNQDGDLRIDPFLGADPIAFLVYDSAGNFAAQFMKRDRDPAALNVARGATANNTSGLAGYDAYFGTYEVDDSNGVVTQTLSGSISPNDVGRVVSRQMTVHDGLLTIRLETTTSDGESVTRTLVWERVPGS